jgi:hypothetical protein
MTVSRATVEAQIKAWITAITANTIGDGSGIPVVGKGEEDGWRDNVYAELYLPIPTPIGLDEITRTYDDGAPAEAEIVTKQCGHRELIVEITIYSERSSGGYDAGEYGQRIINRARLDDFTAILDTAELSFANIQNVTDLTQEIDGWTHTVVQVDVKFNTRSEETGAPTTYISTLKDTEFYDADNPTPPVWTGDIEAD